MQTFHVDIDLDLDLDGTYIGLTKCGFGTFLGALAKYGSPRIVSYDAAPDAVGCQTMVLEFTSYEDALEFAMEWFGESAEDAKEYVETITV